MAQPLLPIETYRVLSDPDQHLARITPIDSAQSRRVMNRWSLGINAAKLIAFQTLWIWFAAVGLFCFHSHVELMARFGFFAWQVAVVMMIFQFCMVFVYPEWPINIALCDKLRDSVASRTGPLVADEFDRVVELVPRDRWFRNAFETATDLLAMRVDENGVWLEGDVDRYELPADSILSAEFQAIRPPGWFTSTNMVIITAKTATGAVELPIAYRDHQFGNLRNSRRRRRAMRLVDKINQIAKGGHYQMVAPPSSHVIARAANTSNPYAAPALLSE